MHKPFCLLLLVLASFTCFPQVKKTRPYITDDFPVTNDMFTANRNSVKIEGLYLDEFVFLKNTALKQTLAFELYTDYHRYKIFLFYNDRISYHLVNLFFLPLKNEGSYPLKTITERRQVFKSISGQANEISPKYFTSNKGIALGDTKEKILKIYPSNYKTESSESCNGNCEIYHWKFKSDLTDFDTDEDLPVAKNSFGHEVIMVFENDKLIVLVMQNEIP